MRRIIGIIGLALALAGGLAPAAPAGAAEKKTALCLVCHVREGATHEEEVAAVVVHEGKEYGFCNDGCAKEFRSDPVAYLPPVFPRPVPAADMKLADLAGAPVTWERFKGQVVLVDFWATWCVPCRKSIPELSALHRKWADKGFSVLGISIDESKDAKKVGKFAAEKKVPYPVAIDAAHSPVWERFRVKAVPAAFLVDREGNIVAQWTGVPPTAAAVEEKLAELLAAAQP
jgi:peroxiredoxin/YHS domain-containing protein